MTRDDKSAFLTARHIETEFLLRRKSKEVSSETSHIGNNRGIDAMVNDLEDSPVLAGLNDAPANLGPAFTVDPGKGDDRNFIGEMVVRDFGTLVVVAYEIGRQNRVVCKSSESGGRSH